MIYSKTEVEHIALVKQVHQTLWENRFWVTIKKSQLHVKEVEYLEYQISQPGISINHGNV